MNFIIFSKKKLIITNITVYLLIFTLLTNSNVCILSISNSTNIFLTKLLPALLPYILLTELLINLNIAENITYGFSKVLCKLFRLPHCTAPTIFMSYFLGYPNAAKHLTKLYEDKKIDLNSCKKLASFTNNASPAYIIGTLGIAMFNNVNIGIILLMSHFLASILIGIFYKSNNIIIQQTRINSNSFKEISLSFEILLKSLFNTIKTLSIIWGFTVIFSLLPILIFKKLSLPNYIYGLTVGIFELSNGIYILINSGLDINTKLCLISFVLSFSSLMVIMQIYSYLYKAKIKLSYIVKCKLLQGIISAIITYLLSTFLLKNNIITPSLNIDNYLANNFSYPSTIHYVLYFVIASITSILVILSLKKKR